MLVLPDRHHFYTALAFHISSILDIRQNLSFSPPPFLFFSYLFIYLSLPFSSSIFLFFFPFLFFFFTSHFFDLRYLFYRIILSPRVGGKSFIFFFLLLLPFQVHSAPVHFHSLGEINVPSEHEFPSLSLSLFRQIINRRTASRGVRSNEIPFSIRVLRVILHFCSLFPDLFIFSSLSLFLSLEIFCLARRRVEWSEIDCEHVLIHAIIIHV